MTPDEIIEVLERLVWLADNGERPSRGELQDAEAAIAAVRALTVLDAKNSKTPATLAEAIEAVWDGRLAEFSKDGRTWQIIGKSTPIYQHGESFQYRVTRP